MTDCRILQGDALERLRELPDGVAQACVTSPPYWNQRDYFVDGQLGLEATPQEYVSALVDVFREVRRVLRSDGVLWIVIGDSYAPDHAQRRSEGWKGEGVSGNSGFHSGVGGSRVRDGRGTPPGMKPKDMVGIPWTLAFALRDDGWWLRDCVIWENPRLIPEPVLDRCTQSYQHAFLLAASATYHFNTLREPGVHDWRNRRNVWKIGPGSDGSVPGHYGAFPEALARPMILSGSDPGGVVLDPFLGSGTVAKAALSLGRSFVGSELNGDYVRMAQQRCDAVTMPLFSTDVA